MQCRFGPPKSFERALDKANTKGVGHLKDLNRVTFECEDPYVMALLFAALDSVFVVCGVKNKFVLNHDEHVYEVCGHKDRNQHHSHVSQ